ncbi:MAG: hypothetical protein ACRDVK_02065 [Acidimicrobiia bacterium]
MSKDRPYEDLRSLGNLFRARVPPELSAEVAAAALRQRRPRRSRTWVAVVVTVVLLALSNVALALASDSAIPGEFLYPLDRTYEWVADRFGPQDRVPERVAEARELAGGGNTDLALRVVTEILGSDESLQTEVGGLSGSGNSPAVRDEVQDLVDAASVMHEASQSGDPSAIEAAITNLREEARDVADTASKGNAGGSGENPSVTAPGQVNSPADTAPGQDPDVGGRSGPSGGSGPGSSNP